MILIKTNNKSIETKIREILLCSPELSELSPTDIIEYENEAVQPSSEDSKFESTPFLDIIKGLSKQMKEEEKPETEKKEYFDNLVFVSARIYPTLYESGVADEVERNLITAAVRLGAILIDECEKYMQGKS